ncbi:hypothetical protein G7070_02195 [Propioniciclava coleopterorum]|uniref:Uncharacterized protein n=1 Tax=Propioniciclava coleopterorum TaxID=2714937 RepID=A0A6G7Y3A2_9ACTN|nr:hypothetical protein [Propioniciclava coleopterorum]QIK71310.1 hypothetical protein G7070_02195 [Propioniciclava coleopterorum]
MIPFSRRGEDLVAHVDGFEAALMISLVGQVAELLGGRAPGRSRATRSPSGRASSSPASSSTGPTR